MGDELIGVIDDVDAGDFGSRRRDWDGAPSAYSDGTCAFCAEGLYTSCACA